jgi:DNA-binding MarR family transcriptional regulator
VLGLRRRFPEEFLSRSDVTSPVRSEALSFRSTGRRDPHRYFVYKVYRTREMVKCVPPLSLTSDWWQNQSRSTSMSGEPKSAAIGASGNLQITTEVMAALRRIIRAIDLHSRSLVQRFGLTGPQLLVLKALTDGAPRTVSEIAAAVNLSQATVTGILDRLERKQMIARARSATDRRKVLVSPTPEAERALAGAPPLLQEHFTAGFRRLPEWEQTQVLSSLQRIVALMEAGDVEAGPILTTGPLDASDEATQAFLDPSLGSQNAAGD